MKKIIIIAGQELEVEAIQTGLYEQADPFDREPVINNPARLNRVELEDLPECWKHSSYRGTAAPDYACRECMRNWVTIQQRDYIGRAYWQKQAKTA
jgi:hypothetical protein